MNIKGIEQITDEQWNLELQQGGRFVVFEYCVSVLIMTFKRTSDIHFIRPGQSTAGKALLYSIVSLLFGWWGFPWGPIYTLSTLATNIGGGKDITVELLEAMRIDGGAS